MAQTLSANLAGHIPSSIANEIIADITRGSAVMGLSKLVPMTTTEKVVPVLASGVGAYWIGEGQAYQTSAAQWIYPKLVAKKLGIIVPVSKEALNDSTFDVFAAYREMIASQFAATLDKAALFGTDSPFGAGASIYEKAIAAGNEFTIGSVAGQQIGGDVADLMALIEADGHDVNAFATTKRFKSVMRKMKDDAGNAVFADKSKEAPAELYGQPLAFADAGFDIAKSSMIAGDFEYSLVGVLQDIEYEVSREATVGGVSCFENDLVALKASMRVGFLVVKDNAFANLKPATV